ncbi:MAG TPA: sodium:solute symporter family protein [Sedimentibacter sp.]|nr:sodium:solute symporter family protein [Sedimentibacter sp.]HOG63464.1 sodium:solute symporter family protein [Sedimentibacter sp.]
MDVFLYFGMLLALTLIIAAGIYSGKKVKVSSDFSVGSRKAGYMIVAGTITGTLVGGASTVGTSELAFTYGFSAWWFTLGAGIGCLLLGLVFVESIYRNGNETVSQILADEYGNKVGLVSSVFVSIGMFINIVAQILSATAIIVSVFNITSFTASCIAALLMIIYVVFGGVWSTGIVGIVKLLLLYISVIIGGSMALKLGGGISHFIEVLPSEQYFNLFARGKSIDLGAGFSLIVGVLSTQTYIQAVLSGKDKSASQKGALLSAVLIPPIGLAGIFIGMYMKLNYPDIAPSSTLPHFVLNYMPPFVSGIIMAALLVTVVGTGAGLALGISTVITKDVYKNYIKRNSDELTLLNISRLLIVVVLAAAVIFTAGNMKSYILEWSFMSMGLRGAAVFVPLCSAFFLKGRITSRFALAGVLLSPVSVLIGKTVMHTEIDSLFIGIAVNVIIFTTGILSNKKADIN